MKFIERFMDTFTPYIDNISSPFVRDVARLVLPIIVFFGLLYLISLPFGLAGQIVQAIVSIVTAAA
jgi:hypothetical protein